MGLLNCLRQHSLQELLVSTEHGVFLLVNNITRVHGVIEYKDVDEESMRAYFQQV